jgi:hypothetical protein
MCLYCYVFYIGFASFFYFVLQIRDRCDTPYAIDKAPHAPQNVPFVQVQPAYQHPPIVQGHPASQLPVVPQA